MSDVLNSNAPADADQRRAEPVVICYEVDHLPAYDSGFYMRARETMTKIDECTSGYVIVSLLVPGTQLKRNQPSQHHPDGKPMEQNPVTTT